MTPRQKWKVWYRQYRIVRRESVKATIDMMIYGTGCVIITDTPDFIRYVPIEKVQFSS